MSNDIYPVWRQGEDRPGFRAIEQQRRMLIGYSHGDPTYEGLTDTNPTKDAGLPCLVYHSLSNPVDDSGSRRI